MRRTFCLLAVLLASCISSFGQSAPKLTTPQIVATFQRLNQTAEIPPTTLFTPESGGTFRFTIVMVGSVANNSRSGLWEAEVPVTNGAGRTIYVCSLITRDRRTTSFQLPTPAKAGKPIMLRVRRSGITKGSKYSVFVVVEQLM